MGTVLWKAGDPLSSQINEVSGCVVGTKFLPDLSHWSTSLSASLAAINRGRNSFTFKCAHSEFTTLPRTEYSKTGTSVSTRSFSCCLSILLRPEFRTLFSPVAWKGFQILCSSLLKELTKFVGCPGVCADDTRQISLARQPQAELNT